MTLYIIAASNNPQTIMCGTPPTAVSSVTVFKTLREDVLTGKAGNTGWAEWSVDKISDIFDRELWYKTNPSLGMTLKERTVADELGTSEESQIDFNIQRLGLWLQYNIKSAISRSAWEAVSVRELPDLEGSLTVGIKYNKDGATVSMTIAAHTREGQETGISISGRGRLHGETEEELRKDAETFSKVFKASNNRGLPGFEQNEGIPSGEDGEKRAELKSLLPLFLFCRIL